MPKKLSTLFMNGSQMFLFFCGDYKKTEKSSKSYLMISTKSCQIAEIITEANPIFPFFAKSFRSQTVASHYMLYYIQEFIIS